MEGVLELPYLFTIMIAFMWGEIACCLLTLGGAADQISRRKTVHVTGNFDVGKVSWWCLLALEYFFSQATAQCDSQGWEHL